MKMVINELLGFNQNEGIFMVLLFFAKIYMPLMANSAAQKRGLL